MLNINRRISLDIHLKVHKPDIICLSETWFDSRVDDTCVFISNFYSVVSRIDRCNGSHGGVVIGMKTEINVHSETIQAKSPVDFATSALFCNLEQAIIVINVYNPPHESPYRLEVKLFDTYLHEIISSAHEKVLKNNLDLINVLIVGDVNLPGIDWSLLSSNNAYEKTFCQVFRKYGFCSLIEDKNVKNDCFLAVFPDTISFAHIHATFSDHPMISAEVNFSSSQVEKSKSVYSFRKANLPKIAERFSYFDASAGDINHTLQHFYDEINFCCMAFIPRKTRRRREAPYYFSSHSIHAENVLNTARRRQKHKNIIERLEKNLADSLELDKTVYLNSFAGLTLTEVFQNLKSFRCIPDLPTKMKFAGNSISGPLKIANAFNQHFASVFREDTSPLSVPLASADPTICLEDMYFTNSEVKSMIFSCHSGSESYDKLQPILLKTFSPAIVPVVTEIFNKIIIQQEFPKSWKKAIIKPLHKKESRIDIENYRPVSMLCALSLIFEKLLYRKFRDRLWKNLDNRQHGFRTKHSTITQMIQYCEKIFRCLNAKESALSVYLDIAKAFDTINHNAILLKLTHFGFDNQFLKFFADYLSNRTQCVFVKDDYSSELAVTSGGPQGSVFAVFMFAVYINDLPSLMENSTYLFADDTKIIGSQMNLFSLQNDLNKAIKWSKENRMQFNNAKFEAICFDVKKLDQCSVHLYADDTEITCKSSVNDLGVVITNNLKWDSHINQRLSKAQQKLFFLKRNVPFSTNTKVKVSLYKSYILSILLYASNVWFSNWPNCRKLEKMQRRALKWALNKKFFTDSDYNQSLIYNNLLPISFLLVRNDLLMLNKIYNCDTALKFDDYWKVFKGPRSNRSAAKQFLKTNFNWTKSVKFEEYFVLRVVKYANVLSQRNDISTFDWTCPTVLFRKQLNSLLKLKALNFKYYQYPVNWSCF